MLDGAERDITAAIHRNMHRRQPSFPSAQHPTNALRTSMLSVTATGAERNRRWQTAESAIREVFDFAAARTHPSTVHSALPPATAMDQKRSEGPTGSSPPLRVPGTPDSSTPARSVSLQARQLVASSRAPGEIDELAKDTVKDPHTYATPPFDTAVSMKMSALEREITELQLKLQTQKGAASEYQKEVR
jgi:hypothetical protein